MAESGLMHVDNPAGTLSLKLFCKIFASCCRVADQRFAVVPFQQKPVSQILKNMSPTLLTTLDFFYSF